MPSQKATDWVKSQQSKVNIQVDYATHKPTENELNQLCYLSMKQLIGWNMRKADFMVVRAMCGEIPTVADLDKQFIPQLAEYMWDHLLSEDPSIGVDDLIYCIQLIRDAVYSMPEDIRNNIEPIEPIEPIAPNEPNKSK